MFKDIFTHVETRIIKYQLTCDDLVELVSLSWTWMSTSDISSSESSADWDDADDPASETGCPSIDSVDFVALADSVLKATLAARSGANLESERVPSTTDLDSPEANLESEKVPSTTDLDSERCDDVLPEADRVLEADLSDPAEDLDSVLWDGLLELCVMEDNWSVVEETGWSLFTASS